MDEPAKTVLQEVTQSAKADFEKRRSVLSFPEYLELVGKHPRRHLRNAGRYRGLAALSTWLPEVLATALPKDGTAEGFPILVQHGETDPLVGLDKAEESLRHLKAFKADVTFRKYPMAHEIRPESLRDLDAWLGERLGV